MDLSVTYGDVQGRIFWKDKTERAAGSYLVHIGETIRTTELERFGIDPLEMRAIDARPVEIGPGERPLITNNSHALQVVSFSRSMDSYSLTLKNTSGKTIGRFTLLQGGASQSSGGIPPGGIREVGVWGPRLEEEGITIQAVVFEDGSFEAGGQTEALVFLAEKKGRGLQAPYVLERIAQTARVGDGELVAAFEKLEDSLRTMPEAVDKEQAVGLLRSEYPSLDDRSIAQLYERLKSGLYWTRNLALSKVGELKRRLSDGLPELSPEEEVAAIRRMLSEIKAQLEAIVAAGTR